MDSLSSPELIKPEKLVAAAGVIIVANHCSRQIAARALVATPALTITPVVAGVATVAVVAVGVVVVGAVVVAKINERQKKVAQDLEEVKKIRKNIEQDFKKEVQSREKERQDHEKERKDLEEELRVHKQEQQNHLGMMQLQYEEDIERQKWEHETFVTEMNIAFESAQEQMRLENRGHLQKAAQEFLGLQHQINTLMYQMQSRRGIATAPLPESLLLEGPHLSTHTVEGVDDNSERSSWIEVEADNATPQM